MKKLIRYYALAAVLALIPCAALAQVPSTVPPYNTDTGVLITNAARAAGTVTSSQQNNLDKVGVVCTLLQTAVSGTPSTTFSIQGYDAATNSYNTLATSTAVTTSTSAIHTAWVQPGLIAADVPTNGVGKSTHLPRTWRLSQTITDNGADDRATSKIGCNYLK